MGPDCRLELVIVTKGVQTFPMAKSDKKRVAMKWTVQERLRELHRITLYLSREFNIFSILLKVCFRVESNCNESGTKAGISFFHNNVKITNIETGFTKFEHCFPRDSIDIENDTFKLFINGYQWSNNAVRFKILSGPKSWQLERNKSPGGL